MPKPEDRLKDDKRKLSGSSSEPSDSDKDRFGSDRLDDDKFNKTTVIAFTTTADITIRTRAARNCCGRRLETVISKAFVPDNMTVRTEYDEVTQLLQNIAEETTVIEVM
ncbi:MAG: hypothetical protein M3Q99_09965 [Acidobacteriota bacterium]|nr:hypothetical protein [Acidobacteriota bacterium]